MYGYVEHIKIIVIFVLNMTEGTILIGTKKPKIPTKNNIGSIIGISYLFEYDVYGQINLVIFVAILFHIYFFRVVGILICMKSTSIMK